MFLRLNQEAAKTVKYGGVPEDKALELVTINPARQLHLDDRIGSIEPGKDADLMIWNGNPLSVYSACEQT
jgi:imidazolonepropionase-like amidohydrolase